MASEASGSTNPADSYVGSLISLTSKYEIRYEGILYNINTDESSIGLRNVRSYGTEGRKKDGQQVPPNDKIYEYILFRGSDIKDLQVKASPPVQAALPSHSDPAIIQSHYSRPPTMSANVPAAGNGPVANPSSHTTEMEGTRSTFQGGVPIYQPGGSLGSWGSSRPLNADGSGLAIQSQHPPPPSASTSLPSTGSGSVADLSSPTAQMAAPRSPFQGGIPLYQPGVSLGSWGSSPPNADGSGLAMPMYWQGFYGPPNGLSYVQQQSFHHSPSGLSMPHSMQQPIYPGVGAPILTASPNLPGSGVPAPSLPVSDLRKFAPPLLPTFSIGSANLTSSTLQSTLLPQSAASEISQGQVSNMVSSALSSTASPSPSLPLVSQLTSSGLDTNGTRVPGFVPKTAPILSLPYQVMSTSVSNVGTFRSSHTETSTPPLVTPGQLLQPVLLATLSSSVSSDRAKKDVEVVQAASSKPPPSAPVTTQAPKLPFPTPANQKLNRPFQTHPNRTNKGRERGRGNGISRPVTKFTEEFDFMAMNEKFKKDEVWGDLGKTDKTKNKEDKEDGGVVFEDNDDMGSLIAEKPVYVKDDFFDTLSCNSLGNGPRNARPRFSEQMKLDSETFGDFPRHRGGRGGRWPGRGGRSRGSYYGRGYGYVGRGQGYY